MWSSLSSSYKTALSCLAFVMTMVGLTYASAPLYDLFCRVTGYNGTTQVAAQPSQHMTARQFVVQFDANVAQGLGWQFKPKQRDIVVNAGENALVYYVAVNDAARSTVGTATFNVTPPQAGAYFNKVQCFCFTEQVLKAGEGVDMAVNFFIDPAIEQDPDLKDLKTITLSYTFFPLKGKTPVATTSTTPNLN